MVGWSDVANNASLAVGEIASTISQFGPNDEGKAVNAAKKAGNKAKQLEGKGWVSWLQAKKTGEYANKAEYAKAKANALKEAYDLAYNQVMDLYHERMQAQVNGYNNETAEDILVNDTLGSKGMQFSVNLSGNDNQSTSSSGCAGMAALLVGGVGTLSYLIYELVNLV